MAAYEKPGLLEQDRALNKKHAEMIAQTGDSVKGNWLKEFHARSGLTSPEIVALVRPVHPSFDNTTLSKCENTDKYGVQLSRKAMCLLKRWEAENHA